MPADSPIEQSLALKKRARRRLVGAIAIGNTHAHYFAYRSARSRSG